MFNTVKQNTNLPTTGSMLTTAIVTNNTDPDNLGRIKVQYPWNNKTEESDWARMSTLMAGNERGLYFIPEVDEEVLVAFVNGDIQSPIVIGSLWNQSDGPPETNENGKNNIRKIRSRSGHEIIFNDSDDDAAQKLEIKSSSGHSIVLDDASGSEKISITDNAGSSIEFDTTQQAIKITSGMDVSIEATNITIKASGELVLKGAMVRIN